MRSSPDPSSALKSATVIFEKETASKTALLLDNTQLGRCQIQVAAANTDQTSSSNPAMIRAIPRTKVSMEGASDAFPTKGFSIHERGISRKSNEPPVRSIVAHYTISRDLCGSQDSVVTSMLSALAERSDDRSTILSRLAR